MLLLVALLGCSPLPEAGIAVADPDSDGDGAPLSVEAVLGSDPSRPDTDGDGTSDGEEWTAGTDPLDAFSHPYQGGYAVGSCGRQPPIPTGRRAGDVAQNIRLPDQYDEPVDLYAFCGRPVVAVICACDVLSGGCGTCSRLAEDAVAYTSPAGNPAQVLVVLSSGPYLSSVDAGIEARAALAAALPQAGIPVVEDRSILWMSLYEQDRALPSVVVLDEDMVLLSVDAGLPSR